MSGTEQVQVSGTTDSNVNIVFGFISQVEQLCEMQTPADTFQTTDQYNEAVADCTFSNLTLLQTQAITTNCSLPNLTAQEIQVCSLLGSE
jgi:hypothetical protein